MSGPTDLRHAHKFTHICRRYTSPAPTQPHTSPTLFLSPADMATGDCTAAHHLYNGPKQSAFILQCPRAPAGPPPAISSHTPGTVQQPACPPAIGLLPKVQKQLTNINICIIALQSASIVQCPPAPAQPPPVISLHPPDATQLPAQPPVMTAPTCQ